MQSISDLIRTSTFIFTGTVLERGASSVPLVEPDERLITVRLDESLRVDPILGDLRGNTITVEVGSSEHFEEGQEALFFANRAVAGRGIAVREVAHVDVDQAELVADGVAQLPHRHLLDLLQDAALVVDATITDIDPPEFTFDQHDGQWAAAHLEVNTTLKGTTPPSPVLYFATAEWPPFDRMPRFEPGQAGVFILHLLPTEATNEGSTLPEEGLVATDHADFQESAEGERIQELLAALR